MRGSGRGFLLLSVGLLALPVLQGRAESVDDSGAQVPPLHLFFQAAIEKGGKARPMLDAIGHTWRDSYTSMIVELSLLTPHPGTRSQMFRFLRRETGRYFGEDSQRWMQWVWEQPYDPHPDYLLFKRAMYSLIDPRMGAFFPAGARARIRLDEVQWGGVEVNGIPPLDHPRHVSVADADYLKDRHVVFGLAVDGEARAYPKRILAWHEMALDTLGGVPITLVYCTLCGTAIPYRGVVGDRHRTFGTSGLLFRSNKLMFDHETNSLWSTLLGEPVIGELAGSGLRLEALPIVTTRWGEWRSRHPDTTVLSLDTGHERDYGEGRAYRDYFSTDKLMFQVPERDGRLRNKAEVLGILLSAASADGEREPLAVRARFLQRNRVFATELAGRTLTIVTSRAGANRVFDTGDRRFERLVDDERVVEDSGEVWQVTEDALVAGAVRLRRVPAFRAFWFGWVAQFPGTKLIK
ncbi:MAG: DUF3179 domain-containing protein [Gammaproteobacteria bacterium]|nr:DUF3179 domain-containing protein [Gammaproteobacteria bacterium]